MNRARLSLFAASAALLAAILIALVFTSRTNVPLGPSFAHDVRPGPGVSEAAWLSAYGEGLTGTPGDTPVYVLRGPAPGGTVLVLGGTHGNEIAGIVTAVVLVEHARVTRGRLIVIPNANNSAVSYPDPVKPGPEWIAVESPSGTRRFKYGARRTRPEHQGAPDPERYRHPAAGEALAGNEGRNLARVFPGNPDGLLTQRIAAAIVRLVEDEQVDVVVDLHENEPGSRLAWAIVSHPKNAGLADAARKRLEVEGLDMTLETSPRTPRGVSHLEIGEKTRALAFLFETPNPGQVTHPEHADVTNDPALPLARRVGAHLSALRALLNAHNATTSDEARIEVHDVPSLADVVREGVGHYLR
jgi:predicted deacylase